MKRNKEVKLCFATTDEPFSLFKIQLWLIDSEPYESKLNQFKECPALHINMLYLFIGSDSTSCSWSLHNDTKSFEWSFGNDEESPVRPT